MTVELLEWCVYLFIGNCFTDRGVDVMVVVVR